MSDQLDAYTRGYMTGLEASKAIVEELRETLAQERAISTALLDTIRQISTTGAEQ